MSLITIIRGGGDLASGVALRLYRAGIRVLITELDHPLVVRRMVSFAEAVHRGVFTVENITARRVYDLETAEQVIKNREIPVIVDPECKILQTLTSDDGGLGESRRPERVVLVDGRMTKDPVDIHTGLADLVVGLGPGFVAGKNCHVAIETKRGHRLGRVIWEGMPETNTGIPEKVSDLGGDRVLRAPTDGVFKAHAEICDHIDKGQKVGEVRGLSIIAPFSGILRGLIQTGIKVTKGMKIGDLDPRDVPEYCWLVSDKSLSVGGGVLVAILSRPELRPYLWDRGARSGTE